MFGGGAPQVQEADFFLGLHVGRSGYVDVTGTISRQITVAGLLRHLQAQGIALGHLVINLGAAEGLCLPGSHWDPANCLLEEERQTQALSGRTGTPLSRGIFVDGDTSANLVSNLASYKAQGVETVSEYVFPHNITVFLERREVLPSTELDLLKIDVDGFEYSLMETILTAGYRPKVLHIEPLMILPPFVDTVGPPSNIGLGSMLTSLGATVHLAERHGYVLLMVDIHHATFLRRDLERATRWSNRTTRLDAEALWHFGHLCHPLRRHLWCEDFYLATLGIDSDAWSDPSLSLQSRQSTVAAFWRNRLRTGRSCPFGCPTHRDLAFLYLNGLDGSNQ